MTDERIIRVNLMDELIGFGTKEECHKKAFLHRAFSVFLYHDNQMLIQQRSAEKYHSGGLWSNACCSHPRENETLDTAVKRRLKEELNVVCSCEELFSFVYFCKFDDELYEYEYDHVWLGEYKGEIICNPKEAADCKWIDMNELLDDMEKKPEHYSVWFLAACPRVIQIIHAN